MGIGHEEWRALPWHIRRAYLEGMEQDDSVPLTFQRQEQEEAEVIPGLKLGTPPPAPVIDITGMISGLEAFRGGGR